MRNISFAMTAYQVRQREKNVTRRIGWKDLKPGTLLQPIVKGQGLKKGETVECIGGPVRVVSVRRERLSRLLRDDEYSRDEMRREGFPKLTPDHFVPMFCGAHGCTPGAWVTRIEFEYVEGEQP